MALDALVHSPDLKCWFTTGVPEEKFHLYRYPAKIIGAEGGGYFLDVYAATKDAKYLHAAVRIAETYAKQQRDDGSWLLFVTPHDGKAVTDNVLISTLVIEFWSYSRRSRKNVVLMLCGAKPSPG